MRSMTPVESIYSVWDPATKTMVDKTFTLYDLHARGATHWHLTDVDVITHRLNELFGLNLKAYRKYWGLEVLFNKRFSNRWQMLASYVYSQTKGTMGNSSAYRDIGWNSYEDPNTGSTSTATSRMIRPTWSRSRRPTSCRSTSP